MVLKAPTSLQVFLSLLFLLRRPTSPFPMSFPAQGIVQGLSDSRVILTVDLDNTIWSVSPIISSANSHLQDHLSSTLPSKLNIPPLYQIMNGLYEEQPEKYHHADYEGPYGSPVHLTRLRIDAVRKLYAAIRGDDSDDDSGGDAAAQAYANNAFELWNDKRHEAASDFLSPHVIPTLRSIRSRFPFVCVGVITNGNSDVYSVPSLKGLFDFAVQSDVVGYNKPHSVIFDAAEREATKAMKPSELGLGSDLWIHVGDDVSKDCVGAKRKGCKTILTKEFLDNPNAREDKGVHLGNGEGRAVTFLGDNREYVDAIVDDFRGVGNVVEGWIEEVRQRRRE